MKRIAHMVTGILLAFAAIAASQLVSPEPGNAQTSIRRLYGHAWSSNIGWVSFSESNDPAKSVIIRRIGGVDYLDGFAWSPNIGWIKFGCSGTSTSRESSNQFCVKDSVTSFGRYRNLSQPRLSGTQIIGSARTCAGMSAAADCFASELSGGNQPVNGWDGIISLSGTGYGITVQSNGRTLAGPGGTGIPYAWGGDNIGWLNFSGVSIESVGDLCTLSDGTVLVEGGSAPVITKVGTSCTSTMWSCINKVPVQGATVDVSCDDDVPLPENFSCTHGGKTYEGDTTTSLFSRSQVRAGQSCSDYSATLRCVRVPVDGPDNDTGRMEIIAPEEKQGDDPADYVYPGCRPLPDYIEQ
ncbi:MAG TPA: hypothetical protein VGE62_03725 [Candidatus Paceibacterota bacterium]